MSILSAANKSMAALVYLAACLAFLFGFGEMARGVYLYAMFGVNVEAVAGIATSPFFFSLGLLFLGASRSRTNWFAFKRQQSFLTVRGLMAAEIGFLIAGMLLAAAYLSTKNQVAFKGLCLVSGTALGMLGLVWKVRRRAIQPGAPRN
jgi:hypothetical protein